MSDDQRNKVDEDKEELEQGHDDQQRCNCFSYEKRFKLKVEYLLMQSIYGRVLFQVNGLLALSTNLFYVVIGYTNDPEWHLTTWYNQVDWISCMVFLMTYLLKLYIQPHRVEFLLSFNDSILDLLVFLPVLFVPEPNPAAQVYNLIVISRYTRVMITSRTMNRGYYFKLSTDDVERQLISIILLMAQLFYISSGIFTGIENQYMLEADPNLTPDELLSFHTSLYFVIVTLLTVGYGEIVPLSGLGQVLVVVIIVFTIVIVPAQSGELLRLMTLYSRYRRLSFKSSDLHHIVVIGSITGQSMQNFCGELFHPDHGNIGFNAVVMQPCDPRSDMEPLLIKYEFSVTYLSGKVMENKDLKRCDTQKADACVLLTNKNSKKASEDDHRNILNALAIKKHVYDANKDGKDDDKHNMRIIMQLIKPESKNLYFKSLNLSPMRDQLIIVEEIKMNLLAKSCFAPGLISMISNLIASAQKNDEEGFEEDWLKDYVEGMDHEIYRVNILEIDYQSGLSFNQVARIAHSNYSAIVFAAEIELKGSNSPSVIRLNPSRFVFQHWDKYNFYLYIICSDEAVARQVQKLEMPDYKYERITGKQRIDANQREQRIKEHLKSSNKGGGVGTNARANATNSTANKKDDDKTTGHDIDGKLGQSGTIGGTGKQQSNLKSNASHQVKKEVKIADHVEGGDDQGDHGQTGRVSEMSSTMNHIKEDPLKGYIIYKKPQSQMEAAEEKLLNRLSNHVVVCGIHSSIYHFILPLRAKYLKNYQQDIVIITPNEVPSRVWDSIARFQRIFLVYGSPLETSILLKAKIDLADKAVILGIDPTVTKKSDSLEINDEMLDAQSIFIYKAIKGCNPNLQILTELSYFVNIDFLLPKKQNQHDYTLSRLFAAGEVYISAIIDTLTAQAYYNPHIVTILQQILVGKSESSNSAFEQELGKLFGDKLEQGNIWQIAVPEECISRNFEKLFKFLLDRNLVALGLYRLPQATDNVYPYVFSNPDPKLTITVRDRVFVLGNSIPKDLMMDQIQEFTVADKRYSEKHETVNSKDFYGLKNRDKQQDNTIMDQIDISSMENKGATRNKSGNLSTNLDGSPRKAKDVDSNESAQDLRASEDNIRNEMEKDQLSSLEFMKKSVETLHSKLDNVENLIQNVKGILSEQNSKIRTQIKESKDTFFKQLDLD